MITRLESRLALLQRRREYLVDRAALQRLELAEAGQGLEHPLRWMDTGMAFAANLRANGGLSALGAMLAMSTRLARTRAWVARGLMLYQAFKFVRSRFARREEASV